jgi:hypothetical protein
MTKIRGRFIDGKVVLEGPPPDWEEGLELDIGPHRNGTSEENDIDEPMETPEEIEAWIAAMDAIPPLKMTPEEEAEFNEWNRKIGEYSKEAMRKQFEFGIEGAP